MSFDAFAANGGASVGQTSSAPPAPSKTVTATSSPAPTVTSSPTTEASGGTPTPEVTTPKAPKTIREKVAAALPSASAVAPAVPEMPAFTPEFKFKVLDSEHEIPEMFRGLVKDAETQQQVKEIFEKAYGLDHVKTKHQALQQKFQETSGAHTEVMSSINELRETYQRGDFDTFFQRLQIPEEKILQWVINKAQYNQLPPEQRKVLDDKRSAEMHAVQLEKQAQTYRQQLEAQQTQAKRMGLQFSLEKPEVKQFSESYDSRAGKPGQFIKDVIQHGEYVWYASQGKIDLTPEQAIQAVMARYGGFIQSNSAPTAPNMGGNPPAQAKPAAQTLPNLSGRGASSAVGSKPKVRSLDDLKKLAAQMGA